MAGKTLDDDVKLHIVHALACYDAPSVVVESVKAEFGVVVTRQQVETYDPNKRAGRKLSARLREVFEAARNNFKEATGEIPIAQRAFRLRALHRMAERAEQMRNLPLAAQLMEQAAKEVGDVYTNRQKLDATVRSTARVVMVPPKEKKV